MKPLSELFYLENDFYVCTFGRWTGWGMNQGHVSFILWCKRIWLQRKPITDLLIH